MRIISVYLPEPYVKALDELVDSNYYVSRGEIIRAAIRDLMKRQRESEARKEPIAIYG